MKNLKFKIFDKENKIWLKNYECLLAPTSPTWTPINIENNNDVDVFINNYYTKKGDIFGGNYSFFDWANCNYVDYVVVQFINKFDSTKFNDLTEEEKIEYIKTTGKKEEDWKGYELYEGDILDGCDFNGTLAYGYIKYNEYSSQYQVFPIEKYIEGFDTLENTKYIKKIGNIYSNPELLKY